MNGKVIDNKSKKIIKEESNTISIISHQLRTSLTAFKWTLKMLLDGDVGKLTSEQIALIQKTYSSNENMISLINNLLEVNHSDEKISISYDFKKIDILYLLEQTLLEFYGETTKKGIELIFIKPESPISPVNCDEKTIRIVFQNLIENAIKYSNKGGKIFVFLKQKDKNVEISIYDSGIGISDSDKENIFKKFYRTKRAIKKDSVGSGIGLFTTKNIIEKHNGKIWFENTAGGGTTFFVLLPIS